MASNTPIVPAGLMGPLQGLTGPMTASGPVGPAPTIVPTPIPKPSFFDSFMDIVVNKGIAPLSQALNNTFGYVSPTTQQNQEAQMRQAVQDKLGSLANGVKPAQYDTTKSNIVGKSLNTVTNITNDILLSVAKAANNYIVKPLITVPLSTAGIITDPNSPLYKDKKYGVGFQPGDFMKAVTRANSISPMQSIASNSLFQNTPPGMLAQIASNTFNGPDFSKVNVFSDKSIKENYSDNTFGKIFTGVGDIAITIPAFSGLGKVVDVAGNVFREAAGNVAKNAPLQEVFANATKNVEAGITHATTGGLEGHATNIGSDMIQMSKTTSPSEILKKFTPYSNNRNLLPFVARETDPMKIWDMILTDNGDVAAAERLYAHNQLAAYSALGGKDAVASKVFLSQGSWLPQGDILKTIHDVHFDSVKLVPEHEQFWNAFHSRDTNLQELFGTRKVPMEGPLANATSSVGGWIERQVGGQNNVTTRLVSLIGSRMPNWYVSFSNTTPWRAISELRSSFASMKMFRNPDNIIVTGPEQSIRAGDYIKNVESNYLLAPNDTERYAVLNNIDSNIGLHMAMTKGLYENGMTEKLISDLKARMQPSHKSLAENGMGIDIHGDLVKVDPQTQPQLANSIRMFPWNKIEKELDYHQANIGVRGTLKTENYMHSLLSHVGQYLSFDMIGKPGYIGKQSLLEPSIGAAIALGPRYLSENLPSAISNSFVNNTNRIRSGLTRVGQLTTGQRSSVVSKVAELGQKLDAEISVNNRLHKEHDAFFVLKTKTDKTVERYGPEVIQAYKESAKRVRAAEDEYRSATKQWGDVPEIPSIANLQRRMDHLEKHIPIDGRMTGNMFTAISDAKLAIRKAKEMSTIFSSAEDVAAKENAIVTSYDRLDAILKELGIAHDARADVFGKTIPFKQRRSGPKESYRFVGDKYMKMPDVFDQNAVGEALKAEISNVQTSAITYANELNAQTRAGILRRHTPDTTTDIHDPLYYNELSGLMNKEYRQDPLVKQILAGNSVEELTKWATSDLGKRYMNQFGITDTEGAASRVLDKYSQVNRYLPSAEARALVLKQEVLSPQLEKLLSPHIAQLVPIHARDFDYGAVNSGLGDKYSTAISDTLNRVATKTFTALMRPENPLRERFVGQLATDINARKATFLQAQGVPVTFEQLEALKQSSFIEAANEMRKIFYTVPQANRMIYASRYITMFPTATFNAFYRYARMAVKYPVHTLGFLHAYNSMFESFGLDKNGNPVTDVRQSQYLVLPLSKELGAFGGQGVRVSARSIGFILNAPSLHPLVTVPVSALVQHMPSSDATLKNLLGSNYDVLFPYGTNKTDLMTVAVPQWLRDGVPKLRSSMAKAAYLNSVQSLYDYHQVMVSMGTEKIMPSLTQIQKEATGLYTMKAWYEFLAPAPVKIDTSPMSPYQQLYYGLATYYKNQGQDAVTAGKNAGRDFLATVGPNFPLDQITFSTSPARASIAKTQEGFARVYKDNVDLTKQLVHLDPQNPYVVGLMTMDINVTDTNRSAVVAQKLGQPDTTLPDISGVVALNDLKLNPEQVQEKRLNQRTWDKFFFIKTQLDIVARGYKNRNGQFYKSMDSIPTFTEQLKKYATDVLGKENPTWLVQDYNQGSKSTAKAYVYAKGLDLIVNDKKFMDANGSAPFWKDALNFNKLRNIFVDLYDAFPPGPDRTRYKNSYVANLFGDAQANPPIEGRIGTYDPQLQRIITMYFTHDDLKKVGK